MPIETPKTYSITATIDRFEDKRAVLVTNDGQTLYWDIKNLPEDALAGTVVRLILATSKTEEEERAKLAKTLINEIIKNGKEN